MAVLAVVSATLTSVAGVGPADASSSGSARRASSAGTLVFVKSHNVWLSQGDGSSARALTTDGTATSPYTSPSQSDGGIIAAGRLDEIVRMDQSGHVLNRMNPAPLPSSVSGHPIDGNLQEVAISPDGSLIAYTMSAYLSPPGADSGYRSATGYTAATSFTESGRRGTTFFEDPSWIGNNRTLQGGGYGSQVMVDDLDPGEPVHWFDDRDLVGDLLSTDLGNAELSRDGRYVASVRGYDADTSISWYAVAGDATQASPPPLPTPVCEVPGAHLTDPTWAPDSDSLAWAAPDGIWARAGAGAGACAATPELLVAGGSQPDWSVAPLAPPTHSGPDVPGSAHQLKNLKRPAIKGKARVGGVLTANPGRWSPKPVGTSFRWKRNGKAIKGADSRRYAPIRKDRGARLTVTVTVTRTGWSKAAATSRPIRIRR